MTEVRARARGRLEDLDVSRWSARIVLELAILYLATLVMLLELGSDPVPVDPSWFFFREAAFLAAAVGGQYAIALAIGRKLWRRYA